MDSNMDNIEEKSGLYFHLLEKEVSRNDLTKLGQLVEKQIEF